MLSGIPVAELALDVVVLVRVLARLHQLALHVVQVHRRPVGGRADGRCHLCEEGEMSQKTVLKGG